MNNQEIITTLKLILSKYENALYNSFSYNDMIENSLYLGICWYVNIEYINGNFSCDVCSSINNLIVEDMNKRGKLHLFPTPYKLSLCDEHIEVIYEKCIIPRIEYLKDKINILESKLTDI